MENLPPLTLEILSNFLLFVPIRKRKRKIREHSGNIERLFAFLPTVFSTLDEMDRGPRDTCRLFHPPVLGDHSHVRESRNGRTCSRRSSEGSQDFSLGPEESVPLEFRTLRDPGSCVKKKFHAFISVLTTINCQKDG